MNEPITKEEPVPTPFQAEVRAALTMRPRWTNGHAATKFGSLLGACDKEIVRLRDALQMIADGTICQEAFPDSEGAELEAKTARLIAMAALEKNP